MEILFIYLFLSLRMKNEIQTIFWSVNNILIFFFFKEKKNRPILYINRCSQIHPISFSSAWECIQYVI